LLYIVTDTLLHCYDLHILTGYLRFGPHLLQELRALLLLLLSPSLLFIPDTVDSCSAITDPHIGPDILTLTGPHCYLFPIAIDYLPVIATVVYFAGYIATRAGRAVVLDVQCQLHYHYVVPLQYSTYSTPLHIAVLPHSSGRAGPTALPYIGTFPITILCHYSPLRLCYSVGTCYSVDAIDCCYIYSHYCWRT